MLAENAEALLSVLRPKRKVKVGIGKEVMVIVLLW